MIEEYIAYLLLLYQRIPDYVYIGGVAIIVLGVVSVFCLYGISNGWRKVARIVLCVYVIILYCSTVIFRETNEEIKVELQPLKKFTEIMEEGDHYANPELIMNVIVFVFLGLLLSMAFDRMKWWCLLMVGIVISLSIETMQLIFQRGTVETDDVILNSLGCLIGIAMVYITKKMTHSLQLHSIMK